MCYSSRRRAVTGHEGPAGSLLTYGPWPRPGHRDTDLPETEREEEGEEGVWRYRRRRRRRRARSAWQVYAYIRDPGRARMHQQQPPAKGAHTSHEPICATAVARAGAHTLRHCCGTGAAHIAPSVLSHHSHTAEGSAFPRARPYLKRHATFRHAPDRRLAVTRSMRSQPPHTQPLLWSTLTRSLLAAPLLWRMPARRRTV